MALRPDRLRARLDAGFHLWPATYQIGILVALVSVSAFFIALVTAYWFALSTRLVRPRISVPPLLWVSTLILASSSVTLEAARAALLRESIATYRRMLRFTLILGIAFLFSQSLAWYELYAQRVFLRGNPHGSMFYMFTGAHGAHLTGGIVWLGFVLLQAHRIRAGAESELRRNRSLAGVAAVYWHFMGLLWLGLFAVLHRWA
jgi:cytochrome c oxidase subunit 3